MASGDHEFLIERAVAGDAAALATVLQEMEPRLLKYVQRRLAQPLRSLAGPDDIVQETCYEACRLIGGFDRRDNDGFYRWLVRIANNRIKRVIRRFRQRRTDAISANRSADSSVLSAIAQLVQYRRTPSASAAAHEFIAAVEGSLDRLIPSHREVVTLRFIEGFTVNETAARMNRSSEQVYALSSRALSALREQLRSASRFS